MRKIGLVVSFCALALVLSATASNLYSARSAESYLRSSREKWARPLDCCDDLLAISRVGRSRRGEGHAVCSARDEF